MKKRIALITILSMLPAGALAQTAKRAVSPHATKRTMSVSVTDAEVDIDSFSKIRANVKVIDDGASDTVYGRGSGFDAALTYVSFFYGTGSVARGSLACLPPTPNTLSPAQMFVGYWLPVGATRRTLQAVKTLTSTYPYAPISMVDTMSVRYDSASASLPPLTNLGPGRYYLNSCGNLRP